MQRPPLAGDDRHNSRPVWLETIQRSEPGGLPLVPGPLGQIITNVGQAGLKNMGKTRKSLRQEVCESLKTGRTYVLDAHPKSFEPKAKSRLGTLAEEYGLA